MPIYMILIRNGGAILWEPVRKARESDMMSIISIGDKMCK